MIRIKYRAPDDIDFEASSKGSGSLLKNVGMALIVFTVLTALIFVIFKSLIAAIIVGGGLFISSLSSNLQFFKKIRHQKQLVTDLRAIEVIDVEAVRVFDIIPLGSNGPALVFFVESGEGLLLVGQWIAEFEPFPTAQFVLHRWNDSKEPIRIESKGQLIVPEPSSASLRVNYHFGKIELFNANPDTIQCDLDSAFGKIP